MEGKRTRDNRICRHTARGAETSCRGWRGAQVDNVQVDGATLWKRRWGAGVTEKCNGDKQLLMGGGRIEKVPK